MSSLTDFETGTFVNFLSHKFALAQEKSNELLFLLVENKKKITEWERMSVDITQTWNVYWVCGWGVTAGMAKRECQASH